VERGLRRLMSYAIASSGEAKLALLGSFFISNRDVYQAHRLFRCAAAGPCDSGDAYPERRTGLPPNAIRHRKGHLGTDRTFCLDDFPGHIRPRGFQIVAVRDHSTAKIRRTARYVGEAR